MGFTLGPPGGLQFFVRIIQLYHYEHVYSDIIVLFLQKIVGPPGALE